MPFSIHVHSVVEATYVVELANQPCNDSYHIDGDKPNLIAVFMRQAYCIAQGRHVLPCKQVTTGSAGKTVCVTPFPAVISLSRPLQAVCVTAVHLEIAVTAVENGKFHDRSNDCLVFMKLCTSVPVSGDCVTTCK